MADKKENLLQSAKELFSSKGFKDTSVSEITQKAGVATGTYYLYYTSKEQLFMEIYLAENDRLKHEILQSFDPDGEPLQEFLKLMQANIDGMQANPILREWFNQEVFQKIEQKYNEENGLDRMDFMYDYFLDIIRGWQTQGKIRADIESEMIMAIFSTIIVIDLHKDEIGFQYFPKVQEHLTEFIMAGLTNFPRK